MCPWTLMAKIAVLKSRRVPRDLAHATDGGSTQFAVLVRHLAKRGHNVEVFTRLEKGEAQTEEILDGVKLHRVPYESSATVDVLERDYDEGSSFAEQLLRHHGGRLALFDVVHSHHWSSVVGINPLEIGVARWIHTPHLLAAAKARLFPTYGPRRALEAERAVLGACNRVVAVSAAEARTLEDMGVSSARIHCIPNGVHSALFACRQGDLHPVSRALRIATVGRLAYQKGIDIALLAARSLAQAGVDFQLAVAGPSYGEDDYEDHLQSLTNVPELSGRVRLVGPMDRRGFVGLMNWCDLYMQPSRYESQGTVVLEAMAAGKYVVVTDLPAVREYLEGPEMGTLVPSSTAMDFAVGIMTALERSDWKSAIERSRQRARTYTWDRCATEAENVLVGGLD